jgi:endonuclease YncB( thermonuclease family)
MSEKSPLTQYTGEVKIEGKLFLNELFKSGGIIDADTVHMDIAADSVSFRQNEEAEWQKNLRVLHDANYYDDKHQLTKVIVDRGSFSYIKIRLQGIDAPELHYGANNDNVQLNSEQQSKFNSAKEINYRQKWGARATKELLDFLNQYYYEENNKKFIKVYAFSKVDSPNNLFDKFGRAICDIVISKDDININQWLVEKGWAFPDFYNSMSVPEINVLRNKDAIASNSHAGIRESYSKELIVPFDFNLTFDGTNTIIDIEQDRGNLNLPKFFRKQVNYEVLKKCGISTFNTLKDYIKFENTRCYKTKEVMENNNQSKVYQLSDFINEEGYMDIDVGDLIYMESESQLVNKAGTVLNEWY